MSSQLNCYAALAHSIHTVPYTEVSEATHCVNLNSMNENLERLVIENKMKTHKQNTNDDG